MKPSCIYHHYLPLCTRPRLDSLTLVNNFSLWLSCSINCTNPNHDAQYHEKKPPHLQTHRFALIKPI